jgi:hypothetical protein
MVVSLRLQQLQVPKALMASALWQYEKRQAGMMLSIPVLA